MCDNLPAFCLVSLTLISAPLIDRNDLTPHAIHVNDILKIEHLIASFAIIVGLRVMASICMNSEGGLSNKQNNCRRSLKMTRGMSWQAADEFWVVCQRVNLHDFDGHWIGFSQGFSKQKRSKVVKLHKPLINTHKKKRTPLRVLVHSFNFNIYQ